MINTDIVIEVLKLMERVEHCTNTFFEYIHINEDYYGLNYVKDKEITCHLCYRVDGDSYYNMHEIFKISFCDISSSTNIQPYCLAYSPLNPDCTLNHNKNFKLRAPYDFDEAQYFQKLTLHDLPDEQDYIEACKILKSIWSGDFVYIYLNFHNIESHIEYIKKFVDKVELQNAEHN